MTQRASIAALLQDLDEQEPRRLRHRAPPQVHHADLPLPDLPETLDGPLFLRGPGHARSGGPLGSQNLGHLRWGDLEAIDPKGVLEQAKDFGIMSGVAIAV